MTVSAHGLSHSDTKTKDGRSGGDWTIGYEEYLDKVFGGWLGKSIGGTIGARFEGDKQWIDVAKDALFPETIPPNDDLDLQILWLKVLEEKGAALTSDDLAQAWVDYCWYPFCEYGIIRRNWQLGIRPPVSGQFGNQFWESGMGCPIRSEIWGYVFPGRPELAARYAWQDGCLDHGGQSIGAERMFSAMAAMAFKGSSIRPLLEKNLHYLPKGTRIEAGVHLAIEAFDEGLSLFDARHRLQMRNGFPEACDSQINVPIIVLALLYGRDDFEESLLSALRCGYDVDCTMATVGAFMGQMLGARAIPKEFREPIGDTMVMGIAYERDEMTISALARDTARMGVLLSEGSEVRITDAPELKPLPATALPDVASLAVTYQGMPCVGPDESLTVNVSIKAPVAPGTAVTVDAPNGWTVTPANAPAESHADVLFTLTAPKQPKVWPLKNTFTAKLGSAPDDGFTFGVAGAGIWRLLGTFQHLDPPEDVPDKRQRAWHHLFASIDRPYLPEPLGDVRGLYEECSRLLGRDAVLYAYENEIDLNRLLNTAGPYCAYLARTIVAKEEHRTHIVVGNTDSFRIYVNGTFLGERDEHVWWTPQNNSFLATLNEGPNEIVVKLIKQDSADWRFTLGFRPDRGPHREKGQHFLDWDIDLADGSL